jgi:hypothetical protein
LNPSADRRKLFTAHREQTEERQQRRSRQNPPPDAGWPPTSGCAGSIPVTSRSGPARPAGRGRGRRRLYRFSGRLAGRRPRSTARFPGRWIQPTAASARSRGWLRGSDGGRRAKARRPVTISRSRQKRELIGLRRPSGRPPARATCSRRSRDDAEPSRPGAGGVAIEPRRGLEVRSTRSFASRSRIWRTRRGSP